MSIQRLSKELQMYPLVALNLRSKFRLCNPFMLR